MPSFEQELGQAFRQPAFRVKGTYFVVVHANSPAGANAEISKNVKGKGPLG